MQWLNAGISTLVAFGFVRLFDLPPFGAVCVLLVVFAVMARIRTVFAGKDYDAEPHIHKRSRPCGSGLCKRRWPVECSNDWVLENRRLVLRYDRFGFIVQSLLWAACIFLVAGRLVQEF